MCHGGSWSSALPLVLLGLRTAWKPDINSSSAELVYGEPLRVPGEFFAPAPQPINAPEFVKQLRHCMAELRPTPASRHSTPRTFVFKDLATTSHVFLRQDGVRAALQPPYTGPFEVLERADKTFRINVRGKPVNVSVDRLKPAHLLTVPTTVSVPCANSQTAVDQSSPPLITTRAGRRVHFPDFFRP
jgi:hypothetical protein